jgi:hypothetical protein
LALFALPAAAPPSGQPTAAGFNIRTAADLALACTARPVNPTNVGLLNFCNGFAQGVVQMERQSPGVSKICFPTPAPKRSQTMLEFAKWVQDDPGRKSEVASVGLIRFMSERFPCKT